MNYFIKFDAETSTRTEKEGFDPDIIPTRCGDAGKQGQDIGNQQERTYRADSSKPSIFGTGATNDGGMLVQLIDDYRGQVAARKAEIKRIEEEVQKLEFRITEFEILNNELKQEPQQI